MFARASLRSHMLVVHARAFLYLRVRTCSVLPVLFRVPSSVFVHVCIQECMFVRARLCWYILALGGTRSYILVNDVLALVRSYMRVRTYMFVRVRIRPHTFLHARSVCACLSGAVCARPCAPIRAGTCSYVLVSHMLRCVCACSQVLLHVCTWMLARACACAYIRVFARGSYTVVYVGVCLFMFLRARICSYMLENACSHWYAPF